MNRVTINRKEETKNGWIFLVTVDDIEFTVGADKLYLESLLKENEKPEEFIKKSFEFLLEREVKTSILRSFNLKVIQQYFPEYEREITNY